MARLIHLTNAHDIAQATNTYFPAASQFKLTKTGTSDIINQGDRVDFSVENVTNGYCIGNLQGGQIDTSVQSIFCINGFATSGSRMTIKIGVGMEHVNLIAPIDRRYGLEACDTAGSARNYNLDTGDGTSWSLEPTSEAVQQTTPRGLVLLHTPGLDLRMYRFVGGVETFSIKTTHIPITGSIQSSKPFTLGYKTNESQAKQYKLFSLVIQGRVPSSIWPDSF